MNNLYFNKKTMTVEDIMDKLIAWLFNQIHDMLVYTEDEEYEIAASIRDDIENKIVSVSRFLIKKKLTPLSFEDIYYNLNEVKWTVFKEVNDILDIPKERCVLE